MHKFFWEQFITLYLSLTIISWFFIIFYQMFNPIFRFFYRSFSVYEIMNRSFLLNKERFQFSENLLFAKIILFFQYIYGVFKLFICTIHTRISSNLLSCSHLPLSFQTFLYTINQLHYFSPFLNFNYLLLLLNSN